LIQKLLALHKKAKKTQLPESACPAYFARCQVYTQDM
jgi:hypothetical protein